MSTGNPENGTTFLERLRLVLAGRKLTPWGKACGLNTGTIARMLKGHVPGPDLLVRISKMEHVSVTWLLTGAGAPFLIHVPDGDDQAADLLGLLLGDEKGWEVYVVRSGFAYAVVLSQPGFLEHQDLALHYTVLEVIAGLCGPRVLARVRAALETHPVYLAEVGTDALRRLRAGRMGTWGLLGGDKTPGLLTGAREVVSAGEIGYTAPRPGGIELAADAERPSYRVPLELLPEERRDLEAYLALPEAKRAVVRDLIRLLGEGK